MDANTEGHFSDMPSLTEAEVAAALEQADFADLGEDNLAAVAGGVVEPRLGQGGAEDDDSASSADAEGAKLENGGGESSSVAGAPAVGDVTAIEGMFDDETLLSLSKRDAKQLSKKLYKRWKKLSKKASRGDRHHRDEADRDRSSRKDKSKKSSSKKESAKSPKESKSERKAEKREEKRRHAVAEGAAEGTHNTGDPLAVYGAPPSGFASSAGGGERKGRMRKGEGKKGAADCGKPVVQRMTAAQRQGKALGDARALIGTMRQARIADEQARAAQLPALQRLAVTQDVAIQCRRTYMHQALVAEGILNELAYWLCDPKREELAPYDLRRLALELLLGFEVRGIPGQRSKNDEDENPDDRKGSSRKGGPARAGEDDLQRYRGICREDLESTFLGKAVNFVRSHPEESQSNQVLATRLLQRLSHAFRVRRDDDDDPTPVVEVQWRCKGDATVAPPFDPVSTASDRFQQQIAQPDPNDPLSYLRVPPRRYQKGYVTNLSHIVLT